jgi:phosphoribosylglycinamide formyltransferase-1
MRLAVLVSGSGTNLQALLDAEREGRLAPGEIACVVSSKPGAFALARAQAAGKAALTISHKDFAAREHFEEALLAALAQHRVEAVVLAGFMRVLTPTFLSRFPDRIINIHPALLPAFPGVDAQKQALAHGVKLTGCTVHFVSPEVDGGAIIAQAAVPVEPDDDVETLTKRILGFEHRLLPLAVRWLASGRLRRDGRHVRIAP